MLTKSELCWIVVNGHFNNRPIAQGEIVCNSSLAIAMQHLGLLTDKSMYNYADTRGGMLYIGNANEPGKEKEYKYLTFRELLSLLPESVSDE